MNTEGPPFCIAICDIKQKESSPNLGAASLMAPLHNAPAFKRACDLFSSVRQPTQAVSHERVSGIFVPRNLSRSFCVSDTRRRLQERVTSNFDFSRFVSIGSNHLSSASFRCDHCRAKLRSRVHHYWRMRFCSANCAAAYQKRLSEGTQEKIVKLDVDRTSLKMAS